MHPPPPRATLLTRSGEIAFSGHSLHELTRLGRGAFARTDEWESLFSDGRLRTRVQMVQQRLGPSLSVFSHFAALAEHGLPVFGVTGDRVDLIVPSKTTRHGAADVRRHQHPLSDADVTAIEGVAVTSLERTIFDVIRVGSLETAVVAFDAALRHLAWSEKTNTYDQEIAREFTDAVSRRICEHSGARGIRQARFVTDFADGRAQLPGESLMRLRAWQVNLPAPLLQHRVDFGDHGYALLDAAFPGLHRWLEFDGAVKYSDDAMLAGRTVDEVLSDQRRRQSRVEQVTMWRCDHVVWSNVVTIDAFVAFQREISLYP